MSEHCYFLWSIIVQSLGVIGLAYYAYKTRQIAEGTLRNNEILTTPVITIHVVNDGDIIDGVVYRRAEHDKNFGDVHLRIANETKLHAEVRVRLHGEYKRDGKLLSVESRVSAYCGRDVWHVAALDKFGGHCPVYDSEKLLWGEFQEAFLIISIESRQFASDRRFNTNPDIYYEWNGRIWELRPSKTTAR